eukprot:TRINITY_DN7490_c0_g1_i1.p1 TRINITY_DN7490_c0_g1~~TRINITY_DN7490_c0_g1_i1.p1  ORF type:complete len:943 (-),score=309.44 TRINITY_DN7490_c0_g1_i1:224-3052(-)
MAQKSWRTHQTLLHNNAVVAPEAEASMQEELTPELPPAAVIASDVERTAATPKQPPAVEVELDAVATPAQPPAVACDGVEPSKAGLDAATPPGGEEEDVGRAKAALRKCKRGCDKVFCFDNVFWLMHKSRFFVCLFWLIAVGAGVYWAPQTLDETSSDFSAPKNSYAVKTNKIYEQEFGSIPKTSSVAVLLSRPDGGDVLGSFTENFTWTFRDYLVKKYKEKILNYEGYYTFLNTTDLSMMSWSYVSAQGNRSTIVVVTVPEDDGSDISVKIRKYVNKADTQEGLYEYYVCSFDLFDVDMGIGVEHDMIIMDGISLPIALIIMCVVLRSLPLVLIPICCWVTSLVLSFAVMYPIAKYGTSVASYCPPVMMSFITAMSIDYSLFLLTRYVEELHKDADHVRAAKLMLQNAGKIVLSSGGILVICLSSLMCFPLTYVRSFGIAATLAVFFSVWVNLTLTPCLLMSFGKYFFSSPLPCVPRCRHYKIDPFEHDTKKPWFKAASRQTEPICGLLLVLACVIFLIPVIILLFKFNYDDDSMQAVPSNSGARKAMDKIGEDFSQGLLSPYTLMVRADTEDIGSVWSVECFNFTSDFIDALVADVSGLTKDGIACPTDVFGMHADFALANALLDVNSTDPRAAPYRYVTSMMVNPNQTAMIISVQTTFNPEKNVTDFMKKLRHFLKGYSDATPYHFYVVDDNSDEYDAINNVFFLFPIILSCLGVVVVILLLVAFKSIFMAIETVITIGITLAWTYGLASAVFCFNGALYWYTPVITFAIIIGLSLDYDVFLFARIAEFRKEGWDTRSATVKGVTKTGYIISFAGIIMAIAFGGMMFSSIAVLQQIGFMLSLAVLLDTFIVQVVMQPAILTYMRELNWWPRRYKVEHVERMPRTTRLPCGAFERLHRRFIEWSHWELEATEPQECEDTPGQLPFLWRLVRKYVGNNGVV